MEKTEVVLDNGSISGPKKNLIHFLFGHKNEEII
jgi:hypothetical protein